MQDKRKKNKKKFTIIELIIIGIVALNYIVVAFKHLQGKRVKTLKEKR